MIKRVWSDFYGGMIDLEMVDNIKQVPSNARYKYTDEDNVSVYSDGESFWGTVL